MSEPRWPDDADSGREYHQGPVVMRRSKVPGSTSDQRLLDDRGSSDWLHTDPWRTVTDLSVDGLVGRCQAG